MIDVHLHGAAARHLPAPGPLRLDVRSPAEALLACTSQLPGLDATIRAGAWRLVAGDADVPGDLSLPLGACRELHLVPSAEGQGGEALLIAAIAIGTLAVGLFLLPTMEGVERDDAGQRASFLFDGPSNTAAEGGVVPVIYGGPVRVGSTLISAGVSSDRIAP